MAVYSISSILLCVCSFYLYQRGAGTHGSQHLPAVFLVSNPILLQIRFSCQYLFTLFFLFLRKCTTSIQWRFESVSSDCCRYLFFPIEHNGWCCIPSSIVLLAARPLAGTILYNLGLSMMACEAGHSIYYSEKENSSSRSAHHYSSRSSSSSDDEKKYRITCCVVVNFKERP